MSVGRRNVVAYAVAALSALTGLAVTVLSVKALAGWFFMFQFAAVVGATLFGGLGPGLVTMVLSGVGYVTIFVPALEGSHAYRLVSFVLVSVFFAWLAARVRDGKIAAEVARARAEEMRAIAEQARVRAEAAEHEAKVIGAQQERLVAVVSHDLRSPLQAITLTTEHLQKVGYTPERQAKGLSRILTSAERMQSIIRDLLDYAQARHGSGLPVHRRAARLGDICRTALEEVRTARPNRTIHLDVTGDDSVALDPARVGQVVTNLVTNALIHGAADAPVQVSVDAREERVLLEVVNQGAPIPQHLMPTLFDAFRPGDSAGSIGLGLHIVREIARAHGGSVSVRSGELGTAFTVTFPKVTTVVAPATPAE
jgi:signal transduction histidine kinase